MGSTFKGFTTAMALDSGRVSINDSFDATRRRSRSAAHTINDFHGKHRVLTVPEIFIYSSNIGSARMALAVGTPEQHDFLQKLGLLDPLQTELPEVGAPHRPEDAVVEGDLDHHRLRARHLGVADADGGGRRGAVNGGYLIPPTFLPRTPEEAAALARQVMRPETSEHHALSLPAERAEGLRQGAPTSRATASAARPARRRRW